MVGGFGADQEYKLLVFDFLFVVDRFHVLYGCALGIDGFVVEPEVARSEEVCGRATFQA